jgi:hypothetical protein
MSAWDDFLSKISPEAKAEIEQQGLQSIDELATLDESNLKDLKMKLGDIAKLRLATPKAPAAQPERKRERDDDEDEATRTRRAAEKKRQDGITEGWIADDFGLNALHPKNWGTLLGGADGLEKKLAVWRTTFENTRTANFVLSEVAFIQRSIVLILNINTEFIRLTGKPSPLGLLMYNRLILCLLKLKVPTAAANAEKVWDQTFLVTKGDPGDATTWRTAMTAAEESLKKFKPDHVQSQTYSHAGQRASFRGYNNTKNHGTFQQRAKDQHITKDQAAPQK